MSVQKIKISKLCSFYVSNWHKVTMLLPYINQKIKEDAKIISILENSIEENVQALVNKLNLKNREKILSLNWKSTNGIKYSNISNLMKNNKAQELIIIVSGSKEYINIVNKNIERYLEKVKTYINIKIIDCYEVTEFNGNIQEILDEHDKILNTSGEKEITDVFEGYEKNLKNIE